MRNLLEDSRRGEFIIDLGKPHGEAELQIDRFASQFKEIERSGVETNPEHEMQGEEDQLGEMGDGAHVERERICKEEQLPNKEESIIRPMGIAKSGSLEINGLVREISFCNHAEIKYRGFARSKSGASSLF